MKKYSNQGFWFYEVSRRAYGYIPPGEYEAGAFLDASKWLDWHEYQDLLTYMKENERDGLLRTDRTEDLKIIHRLLDILEPEASK
jgi:hypothetical protein